MVIGIDASRANLDHKSGPEWYSYYLIRKLAQLDSKNEYILYTNKPLKDGLLDLSSNQCVKKSYEGEEIIIDKNNFQEIKSSHNNVRVKILKWPFKYFWTLGRLSLEMLFHAPDVLFIPAHVLPLIHPKKSIITIHDIGYEDQVHFREEGVLGSNKSKKKLFLNLILRIVTFNKYRANMIDYSKWSTNYAVKHAKKIISASNYTKNDIIKKTNCTPEKIEVIAHGYNSQIYKKINDLEKIDDVLEKYGITRPFFFYVGRIERKKNIPALIEAFAILKDKYKDNKHKLVLVGDASHGYDEANYAIREFDLMDDIIMTGWVDECDIPYIMNASDAFIFPSNFEGFGIPLLQAMASEIPIAASNITSIPEVASGAALLFNPRYSLSISDAMVEVISNKNLREELISKGRARVSNFSWDKAAKKTLSIFNS